MVAMEQVTLMSTRVSIMAQFSMLKNWSNWSLVQEGLSPDAS